ncbi:autotransporter domain-containing protein [Lysobacter silvisoli]|uniref:Autotransporter domain-containing protein n=2 Tax=Lysobacter silvisoli TaxID=2293254 RepID=A0A371K748_9GAMM|nr:autotransporter domain-containing protein [Lysobacter silvisoli]
MLSGGTCGLTADQAGDANYNAAPQVSLNVTITAASQAITGFAANPAAPTYAPNGTFSVSANGGASGNPVVFASTTPAVCSVAGSAVTMLAAGNCTLTANQAGNASYTAAPQVTLTVVIGAATPTLSWIGNLVKTVGEPTFDLPNPTSSNPAGAFSFTSSNPAVATVSGRTVTIVGPGTATLTATQAATANYVQASVSTGLSVTARPDPTRDPSVVGGLQAQVDASVRFASAQQSNIRDRLRQQRHGSGNSSSHNLALSVGGGTSGALSLAANQVLSSDNAIALPRGWALWSAGTITAGDRDGHAGSEGFGFRSDGVTVGADWRIDERFLLGVAGGFGWNDTNFDGPASRLDAEQRSVSLYGLWRHGDHLFVDGTLGWGRLDFDIKRYSATAGGAIAKAQRDGDQFYGALTVGFEGGGDRSRYTGYGRYDFSRTQLDAYREHGLGIYDLSYSSQDVDNDGVAVGVEGRYLVDTSSGVMRPYWMLEYRKALENSSDVDLNYVVMPVANDYRLGLRSYGEHSLVYGGGIDVDVSQRWKLSFLLRREHSADQEAATSLGLLLSFTPSAPSAPTAVQLTDPQSVALEGDNAATGK